MPRPQFKAPIGVKFSTAPKPATSVEMLESLAAAPITRAQGPIIRQGLQGIPEVKKQLEESFIRPTNVALEASERRSNVARLPPAVLDEPTKPVVVLAEEEKPIELVTKPAPIFALPTAPKVPAAAPKPVVRRAGVPTDLSELTATLETALVKDTTQVNQITIESHSFIPSNRRGFSDFILQSYRRFALKKPDPIPDPDACQKAVSTKEVKTFSYQSFVRDFIQRPTPYRGVLVYHGLGSGKTCTSIASMEALYNAGEKPVYIMTPASLRKNYRDEITKCGPFLYRTDKNKWQWVSTEGIVDKAASAEFKLLHGLLGIPIKWIVANKGGWIPDPSKKANFGTLRKDQQEKIMEQIYAQIDARFQFINYNGITAQKAKAMACAVDAEGRPTNIFDGATIVIDEVHNLIRNMNNSNLEQYFKEEPRSLAQYLPKHCNTGSRYRIGYLLYRMMCNAVGCKVVALSGTPIINFPQELALLGNLLGGDTRMAEATMPGLVKDPALLKKLSSHPEVDFAEIVPRPEFNNSFVRVTPLPTGFRKVVSESGELRGFVRDEALAATTAEIARERDLASWFDRVVKDTGIAMSSPVFTSVTRLPDLEKPFTEIFVDKEQLKVKDETRLILMGRLSGLISYYKGGKADLMPTVTRDELVELEMSDRQLEVYTEVRNEEIAREQKQLKRRGKTQDVGAAGRDPNRLYDMATKGMNSTFKIFSRASCNFVFPKDPTDERFRRPRPGDMEDIRELKRAAKQDLGVAEEEAVQEAAEEAEEAGREVTEEELEAAVNKPQPKLSEYEQEIQYALSKLREKAAEYFSPEALPRYSPKFQAIMDRLETCPGPALIYSQFKTLEGVGLFGLALEAQKGYARFDIVSDGSGGWTLAPGTKASAGKLRYMMYTGDEDANKRNVLKAVFNAAWSKLPPKLVGEIKELVGGLEHNREGLICKLIMITQSGAEGISLANTRQVHIMEPYWNYVRLEQVKGRAIRICSHMDLPPAERNVEVFTYVMKFAKSQLDGGLVDQTLGNFDGFLTTDQTILTVSSAKKKLTDSLFDVMKASAVDCQLNRAENGVLGCYAFKNPADKMAPLFHPILDVDLRETGARIKATAL